MGGERIEWQALGRLRARFAPQQQCNFFGSGSVDIVPAAECGMEGGNGEAEGGGARQILWNSYGTPMEPLYGHPLEQHANHTPTASWKHAERAESAKTLT